MLKYLWIAGLFCSAEAWALSPSTAELSSAHDAVVSIRHYAPDQTGNDAAAFCNGTLLADNVLVTAAHCLKDLYFHPELTLQIDVGAYRYTTRPTGERVRVGYATTKSFQTKVSVRFLPVLMRKLGAQGKKVRISPNEDVAVAYLNVPLALPAEFPFAQVLPTTQNAAFVRAPLARAPRVTSINFMEEMSTDTKRSALLDNLKASSNHLVSKSTARVAPGDSGSPVFVTQNGVLQLVAVVKGRAETIFSNWDVYTLTHSLLCTEERLPRCN